MSLYFEIARYLMNSTLAFPFLSFLSQPNESLDLRDVSRAAVHRRDEIVEHDSRWQLLRPRETHGQMQHRRRRHVHQEIHEGNVAQLVRLGNYH